MGGASRFVTLVALPFPSLFHPIRPSSFLRRRLTTLPLCPLGLSSTKSKTHTPQILPLNSTQQQHFHSQPANNNTYTLNSSQHHSHPWREWTHFVNTISLCSTPNEQGVTVPMNHEILPDDAFVVYEELPEDFVRAAASCLAFARDRPNFLGLLSRREIEVVVSNGTPYLFESALDTARRMREFLGTDEGNVLGFDKASMVDLMKYILSYASNPSLSSERNGLYSKELVELSVRNLLQELGKLSSGPPKMNIPASEEQFSGGYGQTSGPIRQNIEMKRGDWICPKCSFMNFARNVKCLECEGPRPTRQLTGVEWNCPQCDFFNYGRNLVCLRCDCRRPGVASSYTGDARLGSGGNGDFTHKINTGSRLAENEEKAQRWFSKISQMGNVSDINNAATDKDFPEIVPLRKGENRFVVSTRKTPLERRLANYRNQTMEKGYTEGTNKTLDPSVDRSLDQTLGHSSSISGREDEGIISEQGERTALSCQTFQSDSSGYRHSQGRNSKYVPFVPLPPDMFSKDQNSKMEDGKKVGMESYESDSSEVSNQSSSTVGSESQHSGENFQFSENLANETASQEKEREQAQKSERWFKRVAELHDSKDLPAAISDEDFPEIMPMRKGENRFVVSKKKNRSLTSPAYRRQVAMDRANNTNFVPFVPFPPGYFARKDTQQLNGADSSSNPTSESSSNSTTAEIFSEKLDEPRYRTSNTNTVSTKDNQLSSSGNSQLSCDYVTPPSENPKPDSFTPRTTMNDNQTDKYSGKGDSPRFPHSGLVAGSIKPSENQQVQSGWTGKSLEGSAVKEPDPLDMSEEAKAERWFRRVAQIKDISELSQIPDEDFPSIMPMRKGVNRFVVSKRKTPLERRLTSQQYRRNLPIVSYDPPTNKENNNN
ncbi:zinc finger VAR3, chloroplastic [Olea europaea subsp. europaea]|uniref:Zinc finger VAR3, chloroplastic n=1 Tax=Olea europaea subsp. europaea TaxID=158383 RepID=A0A8S0PQ00_OLEEU|nr:zinc finger VAR3, chloroplastic [Olea europaea subsp. europaea]